MTTLMTILVILFIWSMWQFLKVFYIPAYRQGLPVHYAFLAGIVHACVLLLVGVIVMISWLFWPVYRLYQIVIDTLKR